MEGGIACVVEEGIACVVEEGAACVVEEGAACVVELRMGEPFVTSIVGSSTGVTSPAISTGLVLSAGGVTEFADAVGTPGSPAIGSALALSANEFADAGSTPGSPAVGAGLML